MSVASIGGVLSEDRQIWTDDLVEVHIPERRRSEDRVAIPGGDILMGNTDEIHSQLIRRGFRRTL